VRKSTRPDGTPCLVREYSVTIYASGDGYECELYDGPDILSSEPVGDLADIGHFLQTRLEELVNDTEQ